MRSLAVKQQQTNRAQGLCIRTSLGYICSSLGVCNYLFIYTDVTTLRLLLSDHTYLHLKCALESFSCSTLLATIPVLVHEHTYYNFMRIFFNVQEEKF